MKVKLWRNLRNGREKILLETWREIAYNQNQTQQQFDAFWDAYFVQEKKFTKIFLETKMLQ